MHHAGTAGSKRRISPPRLALLTTILGFSVAYNAHGERINCWETQSSQIMAHTQGHTEGTFELAGLSRNVAGSPEPFHCSGTFESVDGQRHYAYRCELARSGGDTLVVTSPAATKPARWEGTAHQAESGTDAELGSFPFNSDGSLPACAKENRKSN